MDEHVSPHFWLSEFLYSETAVRLGIQNMPRAVELANLRNALAPGMERVRGVLCKPILVSSGYRSPELNHAVGGASSSQHTMGLACDFRCPSFGTPKAVAIAIADAELTVAFDQLIHEGNWVHISFAPPGKAPRGELLTAHFGAGRTTYTAGIA